MITNLYIENFVLIDKLNLSFEKGFSAFVGETGAGKSILIDAISLLCGERASSEFVAHGKNKATIEGAFHLDNNHYATKLLQENGFDLEDDLVIITREIDDNGKSSVKINYRPSTVSFLKEVMKYEVDIHGQRDSGYLLNDSNHIHLLDAFIGQPEILKEVSDKYVALNAVLKEKEVAIHETFSESDLEFFQYQFHEIDSANLKLGEDEELEQQEKQYKSLKSSYESYEKILSLYDQTSSSLYEINKLVDRLDQTELNDSIKTVMTDSYYAIEDAMSQLQRSFSDFNFSEDQVNAMEERLFTIQKMKRKYGPTIEDVLRKKEELSSKIDHFENRQAYLNEIDKRLETVKKDFYLSANKLSELRKSKARELDKRISSQLKDLMLKNAKFYTQITETKPTAKGIDDVSFLISMNKGEELKPLSKTASGGELSRLMLGLKVIFTKLQGVETVIFDEIDAGVSGPVATSIGKKMFTLGQDAQVFSVTHLAPVAACSNQMYLVKKETIKDTTKTTVIPLNKENSIEQLALLSSGSITDVSVAAAKELFERNQE